VISDYFMALGWVLACCAIAVVIAAAILHVCWLVEDRARRRRRGRVSGRRP
jgi:peptidoglycan/LPS O-acetylase OafA/YrhL